MHSSDVTDTVSIPDQEILDKDIAELVRDKQDRQTNSRSKKLPRIPKGQEETPKVTSNAQAGLEGS